MNEDPRSPADKLYDRELERAYERSQKRIENGVEVTSWRAVDPMFKSPVDRAAYLFRKHGKAIAASSRFQSDLKASRTYVDCFRAIASRDFSVWDKRHFLRSLSEKTRRLRERFGFGQPRWPADTAAAVDRWLVEYAGADDRSSVIARDLGSLGLERAESVKPEKLARMAYCVSLDPVLRDDAPALDRRQEALRVHLNRMTVAQP